MDPFSWIFIATLRSMEALQMCYDSIYGKPRPRIISASGSYADDYRDPDGRRGPDPLAKDILG